MSRLELLDQEAKVFQKTTHKETSGGFNVIMEGNDIRSATKGIKEDSGKPRLELISPIALDELARALEFGVKKYAEWNWANGLPYTRILGAILRHTGLYLKGETLDKESGLSHAAHIMCNAMFLLHYEKLKPEFDNRPKNVFAITTKQE